MIVATWPWLALILLGAWHGLNPGMGWLFSVALGLQQRSRRAVFVALLPIALGHALAIGLVVLLVYIVGAVIPSRWLQIGGAATLFVIAIWKLWRARHPTWVGMRVSFWDLNHLVMADGKRPWSRAHGRVGTSRREIGFLRSCSVQYKLTALLSSPDCHRCSGRSYDLSFSHRRIGRLDRLRFYWVGGVAPVMDQS
jgi:hypothetical protein